MIQQKAFSQRSPPGSEQQRQLRDADRFPEDDGSQPWHGQCRAALRVPVPARPRPTSTVLTRLCVGATA